jgi:hypothetical protein
MSKKKCEYCHTALVAIGRARANGKQTHNDWASRKYHKKCYLLAQSESLEPSESPEPLSESPIAYNLCNAPEGYAYYCSECEIEYGSHKYGGLTECGEHKSRSFLIKL